MDLEDDPDLEFEFFLAAELSMTVARLRAEMSQGEFVYWSRFYSRKHAQQELESLKAGG
jgi:hypothetical protein